MSHYQPINFSDRVALFFTKSMRFFADTFFKKDMVIVQLFLKRLQVFQAWFLECGRISLAYAR